MEHYDTKLLDRYKVEIESLKQLLEVQEQTTFEQSSLLEEKMDELKRRMEELEDTKSQLEERTKDLTEAQVATLNIMEDLQEAYQRIKEAQDQLIQAEKMQAVGLLASGVAHEVKNPLSIIIQGVDYLEKKITSEEESSKILSMIKDSVLRADNIVRGLLDFSRSSELNLKASDVNDILERSLSLAIKGLKFEHIEIIKELDKDMPKILADENKLQQVFINLFVNAIQAMPEGGRLIVRSYEKKLEQVRDGVGRRITDYFRSGEKAVTVEVEDTGQGITPDNIKKVFDPFFTTKGPREGAGLGLAICRSIIEMHKGLIEVESQEGKGTKFIITLNIA